MSAATSFRGLSGRHYAVAPEKALLFLASNVHAGADADVRLRAILDRPLRWDDVLELSRVHGVTDLLRYRLRNGGLWNCLPEQPRLALDSWHRSMRVQHLMRARQLAGLLAAMGAVGIDPILLKGAALAATAYPDPALRAMVDIDLLVKPDEIAAIVDIMDSLGYVSDDIYYGAAFNRARGYHLLFTPPAGAMYPVEVHWRLASQLEERNTLNAADLQPHTIRVQGAALPGVAGWEARVLAPEAHLVYLATHAAKERHVFSDLKLLADIAALVGGSPLDWPAVVAFARQVQARTATYVALALARDLLGVAVPGAILAELRPLRPVTWALERTLNPATVLDPISGERGAIVKYLVVDEPAITARLLREHLLPPPDAVRAYYPELQTASLAAAYVRHVAAIGLAGVRKASAWLSG